MEIEVNREAIRMRVCRTCRDKKGLLLCRNCSSLSCQRCLMKIEIPVFKCPQCEETRSTLNCGVCGSFCDHIDSKIAVQCPICRERDLGEPDDLIRQLPEDFYISLNEVSQIIDEVEKLHVLLRKMVSHVLYARIIGLMGFPVVEKRLTFLATLLRELNDETKIQFGHVKSEAFTMLREANSFKDTNVDIYRIYYSKVKDIRQRVDVARKIILDLCGKIRDNFKEFIEDFELLHYHRSNFYSLRKWLPEHDRYAVAVVPGINAKYGRKRFSKAILVLAELKLMILPSDEFEPYGERIVIEYEDIKETSAQFKRITGARIVVTTSYDKLEIRGAQKELDNVMTYFKLITRPLNEYMIGSDKEIKAISKSLPNTVNLQYSVGSFLASIRQRLFAVNDQRPRRKSDRELRQRVNEIYAELIRLNDMVREGLISSERYAEEYQKLKDEEAFIESSLASNKNIYDSFLQRAEYFHNFSPDESEGWAD